MSAERTDDMDEPTSRAVAELQSLIRGRYPTVRFSIGREEDPEGIYLNATVDIDDVDEVLDVVRDRLFELQVEEGLPLYVIPLEPMSRVLKTSRSQAKSRKHGGDTISQG